MLRSSELNTIDAAADEIRQRVWTGAAMDVGTIERIRSTEPVGLRRGPGDVSPAVGVGSTPRIDDDSYNSGTSGQNRGMDEEEQPANGDDPHQTHLVNDGKTVNLFA